VSDTGGRGRGRLEKTTKPSKKVSHCSSFRSQFPGQLQNLSGPETVFSPTGTQLRLFGGAQPQYFGGMQVPLPGGGAQAQAPGGEQAKASPSNDVAKSLLGMSRHFKVTMASQLSVAQNETQNTLVVQDHTVAQTSSASSTSTR